MVLFLMEWVWRLHKVWLLMKMFALHHRPYAHTQCISSNMSIREKVYQVFPIFLSSKLLGYTGFLSIIFNVHIKWSCLDPHQSLGTAFLSHELYILCCPILHQKDFVNYFFCFNLYYAFALNDQVWWAPIYFHGRMHPLSLWDVNNTVL